MFCCSESRTTTTTKSILAEVISKKNAEGIAWYLLAAYSKIWEERTKLKKELLSRKKPIFSDLRDFWPIQIANEAKISKLTTGEAFTEERVMGFPGQPLLERLGVWLMDILNDLKRSQCKSYQQDLWRIFLSNGIDPHGIHGRTTVFFENVVSVKTPPAPTKGNRDRTKSNKPIKLQNFCRQETGW